MRGSPLGSLVLPTVGWMFAVLAATSEGYDRPSDHRDVHSFGNPETIRVKHIALDLVADFSRKELRGKATLSLERTDDASPDTPLILDSRDLDVRSVIGRRGERRFELPFQLGDSDPFLGAPLRVSLPEDVNRIEIYYTTSPDASALQWVAPSGTAGGRLPFLYSQSQAIHARSWIPCQDSPAVRVTYEARIHAPEGLRVVMSAESRPQEGSAQCFEMPEAIPPYLIALAIGDLEFREIGPRTGVWAEPSVLAKATSEFEDTEKMLEAAEALFGPYRWGRYEILVLPPSFPFGGMENARLTFATPTVLAGDKSLVALIAHELAHSWSGNLVTNATWRDFWLNEGFTVYLERRIVEAIYGPEQAEMEAVLGRAELVAELQALEDHDEILHVDLDGRDPDEGFTRIPYEKGALFLRRLEQLVGRERFDAFLRRYFDAFAFRSITTSDFEDYLCENLLTHDSSPKIDLETWLHGPGLPDDAPQPASDRLGRVEALARSWLDGETRTDQLVSEYAEILGGTQERIRFLTSLPTILPVDRIRELDGAFAFTERANPEVLQPWLLLGIRSRDPITFERVADFLQTVGRRKYLVPLYQALLEFPEGRALAKTIYEQARSRYHPIATSSIDALMSAQGK